jgi:predicted NBD/HSP70 family sugar kinase
MFKPARAWQLNPSETERFGRDHGIAKRQHARPVSMRVSDGGYVRESDVAHVVTVRRGLSVRCANRVVRQEFEHVLHGLELWEQRTLAGEPVELTSWALFDRFVAEEHRDEEKARRRGRPLARSIPTCTTSSAPRRVRTGPCASGTATGSSRASRCGSAFGERRAQHAETAAKKRLSRSASDVSNDCRLGRQMKVK